MSITLMDKRYRLSAKHKKALADYLTGRIGIKQAAEILEVPRGRIYSMVTLIVQREAYSGKLDAEALLKSY